MHKFLVVSSSDNALLPEKSANIYCKKMGVSKKFTNRDPALLITYCSSCFGVALVLRAIAQLRTTETYWHLSKGTYIMGLGQAEAQPENE